jgi:hypothetical protein
MSLRHVRDILHSWARDPSRALPSDPSAPENDTVCPLSPEQRARFAAALKRVAAEDHEPPAHVPPEWLPPV